MKKRISLLLALLLFLPLVLPATGAWAADVVRVDAVNEVADAWYGYYGGLMGAIEGVKNNKLRKVRYTLLSSFNVGNPINMIGESSDGTPITTLDMKGNTLTIQNDVTFQNVIIKGGSFVVDGNYTLTLDHVVFDNSDYVRAGDGGAIRASNGAEIIIRNGTILKNCTAEKNGGAISVTNGTLEVNRSILTDNKANKYHGGAIYLDSANATITDSEFKRNYARNGGAGGAIMLRQGTLTVRRSVFSDNEAGWTGGAITTAWNKPTLNVYGTVFENNKAGQRGGAVTVRDGTEAVFLNDGSLPTRFIDNSVTNADDFAGGGLFIDASYVRMEDTLITANSARDGGGGLATCTTGTAQVDVMHGAAIYGNTVTGGSGSNPVHPEIQNYQDIFFHTRDHIDHNNNQNIPGRDGFPTDGMKYTLYERMFSGGQHRWSGKTYYMDSEGHKLESYIAQSNPTATADENKAKVIFKGNSVKSTRSNVLAAGGAIADNGLLVIGSDTEETTEVNIVKRWEHGDNPVEHRPQSITVRLHANGKEIATRQVGAADDWMAVFENLPKYEDGEIIDYTITEDHVTNYTHEIDEDQDIITNTYNPGKTDVEVEKEWTDDHNWDGIRPGHVTVHLYANGKDTGESLVLREEDHWHGEFQNLSVYDAEGNPISYTVREDPVSGYHTFLTGNQDNGFTIENVHEPKHEKKELRFVFSKVWSGGVGGEISFRLYSADGRLLKEEFHKKEISANEWQYECWYTMEEGDYLIEEPVSGYMIRYENKGKYAHVTDRLYNGGKIINTKVPQTGDGERPALWMALTAAGILGLAVLIASKRRRRRNA